MKKVKLTVSLLSLCMACMTQFANAQTTNPAPYCDGSFDDAGGFPVADAIKSVSLGTLTNNSGGQYSAPHYVFYSNLAAPTLAAGTNVPMSITFEVHGGAGYGVWIDFNHNNSFEANEKVAGSTANNWLNLGNNITVTPTIAIPANALAGNTRMRVRIVEDDDYTMTNGPVIQPCNAGTSSTAIMDWGETEDYTVNITNGSTAQRPVAAFSASAVTGNVGSIINFTDNSTNTPTAWSWSITPNTVAYQGNSTSSSASPAVKFTAAGNYSVKLVVTNAAGKDSVTKTNYINITSTTAVQEMEQAKELAVYPNPAKDVVYFSRILQGASLEVIDIYGRVCINAENLSGNSLDISQLKEGVYFIRFNQQGSSWSQKIQVSK